MPGRADVITGNLDGTVSVLLVRADGTLEPQRLFYVGGSNRAVVAEDFDSDGDLDVAIADVTGAVRIVIGDGTGGLELAQTEYVGPARALAAGDCNWDGAMDVVVACSPADCSPCRAGPCGDRSLAVLYGRGDGSFQPPTYLLASYPGCFYQVALADVDRDGRLDIIALDMPGFDQGKLLLLAGRPAGGFAMPLSIALRGRGPRDFCVAYVDERQTGSTPPAGATLDIVVAHRDSATLEILLGAGGYAFAPSRTITAGDSPRSVAAVMWSWRTSRATEPWTPR